MRKRRWACVSAGIIFGCSVAALGQPASAPSAAVQGMAVGAMGEATPPEKLPAPLRMEGIGNSALTITTSSAEAQMWFTQGLNLFHDFWDYESSRAFEQSVRVDPSCAMCWWGLYQAESFRGENKDWADAALKRAKKLSRHASPAERLYIQAALAAEKDKQDEKKTSGQHKPAANGKGWDVSGQQAAHVDSRETKVLRKLVATQPDDLQAKIFLAESVIDGFDKESIPKPGTREAQAILAGILASHPDDAAANHYWTHAQEPGMHPELALVSARKLGELTPNSGHMVHMPGHIFYRTGDYEKGRLSFEQSMHVDEQYMETQHVAVDDDWNYVHNLMYLIADLMEAGRFDQASAASAKLTAARGSRSSTLYPFSTRDGITRLDPLLPVALRSADWERAGALLAASEPDAALVNLGGLRTSLLDYTRGMAALGAGDTKSAEEHSKALDEQVAKKLPDSPMHAMPGMGMPSKDALAAPLHSFLDVAAMELRASLWMEQGKAADADALFAKAADAERALGYHEPPMYIRPVAESRADALMRAKRYGDAKAAYQQALKERPNSGFPLFGIAQADVAAKDQAAALTDYRAFLGAWQNADEGLPQMQLARRWMDARTQMAAR